MTDNLVFLSKFQVLALNCLAAFSDSDLHPGQMNADSRIVIHRLDVCGGLFRPQLGDFCKNGPAITHLSKTTDTDFT